MNRNFLAVNKINTNFLLLEFYKKGGSLNEALLVIIVKTRLFGVCSYIYLVQSMILLDITKVNYYRLRPIA